MIKLILFASIVFGTYQADVVRVIDGDTIKMTVYSWPNTQHTINVRLVGVNTPEYRGGSPCEKAAAKRATEFVKSFIHNRKITLTDVQNGKYAGRVLGKVKVNGLDLGEALINAGHAKEYHGGKRGAWC